MNKQIAMKSLGVLAALCAMALAALLIQTFPTYAQQAKTAQRNGSTEQVTVVAPRVVRTRVHGLPDQHGGMGYYDLLTLSHQVSYADLNLALPADEKTLEQRIGDTANEICEQLAASPPAEQKSAECVQRAIESAMEEAHMAISAART